MAHLEEVVPLVRRETGLQVAVSAGILDDDQARRLAAVGTHRYNHNLETARSHFGRIVTTHTWEERVRHLPARPRPRHGAVLRRAARHGRDRRAAHRAAGPAAGGRARPRCRSTSSTPARARRWPTARWWRALEAIRWIALFRLALPEVILRYAGGREVTLGDLQALGMEAGINALIVGNYLTTLGRRPDEDLVMLQDLRMPIGALSKVI